MDFCTECDAVLTKGTTAAGNIIFTCKCFRQTYGGPADTLMAEHYYETSESNQKHEIFIEQSSFDAAANIVMKDCPKCHLNFLTMIRVGTNETTMYTCTCGFKSSRDEYMQ